MKKIWFALAALFMFSPIRGFAAPVLNYTPNPSTYRVSPGGVVDLGATLSNVGDATLYVNGVSISFLFVPASFSALRQNPFFNFFDAVPGTFQSADPVFIGNLAELLVDPATQPGTYAVNVQIIGGTSPSLTDPVANAIGSQTFTIVVASASSTGSPSLATASPLPAGTAGIAYSQPLTATGGTGPYSNWTITSGNLPPGLSLNSATGLISGTPVAITGLFNFGVSFRDSAGVTGSGFLQLSIQSPVLTSPLTPVGGLAQIASGAGWTTTIDLVNLSGATINGQINFYANDGSSLTLPMTFPQFGINSSTASQTFTLAANGSMVIQTGGAAGALNVGWAQVKATGSVTGYSIFQVSVPGTPDAEGTASFDSTISSTLSLPYDETNSVRTGVALANESSSSASITATLFDQNGVQLGSTPISLPPFGHSALFMDQLVASSQNQLGVVQFQSTGSITAVGLRFSPSGLFTSIPILH